MFVSFGADKKMPTHTWHRPTLFLYLLTMPVGRDQQQHQQSPHHTLKLYTQKKTDSLRANAKHRIKKSSEVTQGNKCHCAVLFGSDHMRSVVIPLCFLLNFMFLAWKKNKKKIQNKKKISNVPCGALAQDQNMNKSGMDFCEARDDLTSLPAIQMWCVVGGQPIDGTCLHNAQKWNAIEEIKTKTITATTKRLHQ